MLKTEYQRTLSSLLASAALLGGAALLSAPGARADTLTDKSDQFVGRALWGGADAAAPSGWSSVVVRLSGRELTAAQRARIVSLGGYVYRHLPLIDSVAVRLPRRNLRTLAEQSFVRRLSADTTVLKNDEFTVERSGADVALTQNGATGAGVTIAVIDSGIDPSHADLRDPSTGATRIVGGANFVPGTTKTDDVCGHGTHVAGIVAGNGAGSTGSGFYRTFYGVARKANLVNVRVLDGNGQGSVSNVIAGIQWVVNNKSQYNIRIINLSLGHPVGESYATDPLCQAVESAWKAGIVVVCAAGNEGRKQSAAQIGMSNEGYGTNYGSIQSPANSPYVITVGAMKRSPDGRMHDRVATYSSRGPTRLDMVLKPDIVAPGNKVISTNRNSSYLDNNFKETNRLKMAEYAYTSGNNDSNTYLRLSGTSMAAPVVSGAAALLLEKDPSLSPDTVKARLMLSADKWAFPGGRADALTFGAGYLNIPAALNNTVVANSAALSPPLQIDLLGNVHVDPSRIIWGGADEIWGIPFVSDLRVIWGGASLEEFNTLLHDPSLVTDNIWMDRVIWDITNTEVDLSSETITGEN